jgi:hypothetical protein
MGKGRHMKPFVVLLALLVAAKLLHQEYLFRSATREALIVAYRERAVQACQKDARSSFLGVGPQAWASPQSIGLMIGKSTVEVRFWEIGNTLWNARYRDPYLFLTAGQHAGTIYCEYDIVSAATSIHQ